MSSSSAPRRRATYDDVLAAPEHKVAELIDGELFLSPRPGGLHQAVASSLGYELTGPFGRGRGGPGGWIILDEPELHVAGDVLVPDLAGWRRTRLPVVPDVPYLDLAPDWVCEVLSPSTEKIDRVKKLEIYARAKVEHVWLVNPRLRMLEVMRRQDQNWVVCGVLLDEARARIEPFDAVEIELSQLWADLPPPANP